MNTTLGAIAGIIALAFAGCSTPPPDSLPVVSGSAPATPAHSGDDHQPSRLIVITPFPTSDGLGE